MKAKRQTESSNSITKTMLVVNV